MGRLLSVCVVVFALSACVAATPVSTPAGRGDLDQFAAWLEGVWETETAARSYAPVDAPQMEGRLFALLRYGDAGLGGPVRAVSLRRFREDADGVIINDFLYVKDAARWGDLTADLSALAALTEDDVRSNPGCTMTWRREGATFVGATTPGEIGRAHV